MQNGKCFDRAYIIIGRLGYKLLSARMITIRQCGGDPDEEEYMKERQDGRRRKDRGEGRKERWKVKVCRDCSL